jgi:hypothetical protein
MTKPQSTNDQAMTNVSMTQLDLKLQVQNSKLPLPILQTPSSYEYPRGELNILIVVEVLE